MDYVDGYVVAVPNGNKDAYLALAKMTAEMFRAQGALSVVECWGEDVPDGKVTSFPMAVKLEPGETVVFSWVTWPDKATRDAGWKAMMEDPRMQNMQMPFDGKRMVYGGFQMILNA